MRQIQEPSEEPSVLMRPRTSARARRRCAALQPAVPISWIERQSAGSISSMRPSVPCGSYGAIARAFRPHASPKAADGGLSLPDFYCSRGVPQTTQLEEPISPMTSTGGGAEGAGGRRFDKVGSKWRKSGAMLVCCHSAALPCYAHNPVYGASSSTIALSRMRGICCERRGGTSMASRRSSVNL